MSTPPLLFRLLFVLSVMGSSIVYGQTDSTSRPRFDKVNVFKPEDLKQNDNLLQAIPAKSPKSGTVSLTNKQKWILKFSPVLLVRGDAPLFLERRLSKTIGVEAAAGITFQDYFKEAILNDVPLNKKDPNVSNLSGLSGKLALRFYLRHNAPSDFYISPEVDIKNYRKEVTGIYLNEAGNYQRGVLLDQQKYMDMLIICGTQNAMEFDDSFYLDWFVGVGARMGSEDNVVNSEDNTATIQMKHQNVLNPILTLGVKIGLGL